MGKVAYCMMEIQTLSILMGQILIHILMVKLSHVGYGLIQHLIGAVLMLELYLNLVQQGMNDLDFLSQLD